MRVSLESFWAGAVVPAGVTSAFATAHLVGADEEPVGLDNDHSTVRTMPNTNLTTAPVRRPDLQVFVLRLPLTS